MGSPRHAPEPAGARSERAARSAFVALFREHHDAVRRCLRALGVAPAQVDDATQDVFLTVHRRLDDFDPAGSMRAWIYGIARKVALKYRDRHRRRAQGELHLVAAAVVDEPRRADEGLAQREAAAVVDRCLDALDPDRRAVFVLAELEGLSAPEIAEALGVKLNTVYSRLRSARARFEAALARDRARARAGGQGRGLQ